MGKKGSTRDSLAVFGQLSRRYSLVGLGSVLKGGEDVGVRATLDAVNEVRDLAEEGCYREQLGLACGDTCYRSLRDLRSSSEY
jgi:hypothetical protein